MTTPPFAKAGEQVSCSNLSRHPIATFANDCAADPAVSPLKDLGGWQQPTPAASAAPPYTCTVCKTPWHDGTRLFVGGAWRDLPKVLG